MTLRAAPIWTLGVMLLVATARPDIAAATPSLTASSPEQRYIVKMDSSAAGQQVTSHVRGNGTQPDKHYSEVFDGFSATMSEAEASRLRSEPRVVSVTRDARFHATAVQREPTWGLDRIDQRSNIPNGTYRYDNTGAGVTAFVLDTGIRLDHSQFGGRVRSGYDFVDRDARASDCNGHGTHVAGTIGGSTYGVAKGIRYVALRVLDCEGAGNASDIIDALDWVIAHKPAGPSVVNLSLGGDGFPLLDKAVERTIAAGIPVVAAAGNSGSSACTESPARTPRAVTVAATDRRDVRPSWSNNGRCVDLFAPGVQIRSAYRGSATATAVLSGTSMAAPHVTGAIARYLQSHPRATPAQVTTALLNTATTGKVRSQAGAPNRLLYAAPTLPR